eukprot:TRINITY_DN8112_c0_g1_i2.p1 TRINITY_DN8112_c0_g1~~TRINITY_DN8112_c0_g1_i2.p1  ORF type:complete len:172 (+),score=50.00 TRINITY_DN8112_c0_g1_i2:371-886(+)
MAMQLPELPSEDVQWVYASVELSYFNVLTCMMESVTCQAQLERQTSTSSSRNFQLDKHYNRLYAADAMSRATLKGEEGEYEEAQKILEDAEKLIQASVSASDPFCIGLIEDLKICSRGLENSTSFYGGGQQTMMNSVMSHYNQRSTNARMPSQMAYQTSARSQMQSNRSKK